MQSEHYLNQEDLHNIKDSHPVLPFGPIGEIVDVRTYRRFQPETSSRESAYERDLRVINYTLDLVKDRQSEEELRAEALLMQRKFAELKVGPSSRTKWVGGTESIRKNSGSAFNCSSTSINRLGAFSDLAELLMLGTGVGLRVFQRDIDQLPDLTNKTVKVSFSEYQALPKELREEDTTSIVRDNTLYVTVGDSRKGWVNALKVYLEVAFHSPEIEQIVFDVDSVRPLGERILGFGGTSSGPDALRGIIQDVARIIQEVPGIRLQSIDCMDMCCAIAKGVIAGSSRRSALITLFDEGDNLCANAKKGLYTNPALYHKQYRSQSNNTECIGSIHYSKLIDWLKQNPDCTEGEAFSFIGQFKPSKESIADRIESIKTEGEPGFDNYLALVLKRYFAARKYRPNQDPFLYCDPTTNP